MHGTRSSLAVLLLGLAATAQETPLGPTLVVLNKSAASASLLDPVTGEERARIAVGEGPHEAATSPDGRTVVVCNYGAQKPGNTLTVIDLRTSMEVRTIELARTVQRDGESMTERFLRPHGVQFLPDGKRVVVTSEMQRKLVVVDVANGVVERAIDTDARASHMVALAADGKRAFVANIGSGSVSVIDLEKDALLAVVATGRGSEGIAVRPTSSEVWVTNREADTLSIIDPVELTELAELECGAFPIRVAFTPDGRHALVSCARAGTLEVWDASERKRVVEIAMDSAPTDEAKGERIFAGAFEGSPVPVGVLVEPGGRNAFVANTQADVVTVIDLATWTIARRLKAGPEPDGMCWVPAAAK